MKNTFSYSHTAKNVKHVLHIVIDCGSLTNPDNGQVDTSSGTTIGSTASYSCDTGYKLSDSSLRTCGADGEWTMSEPVCNSKL